MLVTVDRYLIIIIIYQLLVFSGLLFYLGVNQTKSKKILAFFFLSAWAYYAALGSYYLGYVDLTVYLFFLFVPSVLLMLPLFWLYVKSLVTEDFVICPKLWLHFMPAALVLVINSIFFGMLTYEQKIWFLTYGFSQLSNDWLIKLNIHFYFVWDYLMFFIQIPIYFVLITKEIKNHRAAIKQMFSSLEEKKLTWLIWGAAIFFTLLILNNLLIQTDLIDKIAYRITYNVAMLIFTVFLFYSGMKQIDFYDLDTKQRQTSNNKKGKSFFDIRMNCAQNTLVSANHHQKDKYQASNLKTEEKELIIQTLDSLMITKKLYLNSELKITDLVEEVDFSRRQISQTINERLNINFYNFVNRYRINEARRIMEAGDAGKYSIEGVALQVGFKSRSSFYTAFKTETGMTPAEFGKQMNN
jgi:AraC-like DNA-binding protein